MPRVSVFLPLHNGKPFLDAAIDSILGQTLRDIELIIVENGSHDDSLDVARAHAARDSRVRLIVAGRALGVAGAANAAVAAARAPVVARMDQDDVSEPQRLAVELEALETQDGAVAVASLAVGINADGRAVRPTDRWRLLRRSALPPFAHGTVMFRRDAWAHAGGYRVEAGLWEDVDFFLRLSEIGRIYVVPRALYAYRYSAGSTTAQRPADGEESLALLWSCLEARQRTGSYEELLTDGAPGVGDDHVRRARRHRDGVRLWAGLPPEAGDDRGVRQRWHGAHPASLRAAIRLAMRARNVAAVARLRRSQAIEWVPS
jgi:glycosyltransferase involved in cell wall biosynthesis